MASYIESYDGLKMLFIEENPQKMANYIATLEYYLFDENTFFQKNTGKSQFWLQLALLSFQLATFIQLASRNSHDKVNSQLVTRKINATRNSRNISNSQLAFATHNSHFTISQTNAGLQDLFNDEGKIVDEYW